MPAVFLFIVNFCLLLTKNESPPLSNTPVRRDEQRMIKSVLPPHLPVKINMSMS